MAQQDAIPTSNDDTLLALLASIQSLTLTLQENLQATSAQSALATPPPTAPPATTSASPDAGSPAAPAATVSPAAPTATISPAPPTTPAPALPTTATDLAPLPIIPSELAEVYLTTRAHSSEGIHPSVLQALPHIVSAVETGPWFVVTVGQYTGVYQEWHQVSPIVSGWSGACYKRHPTKSSALTAYDNAWIQGSVRGGVHPDHKL